MSTAENVQKLQQDLQNELMNTNQLLMSISMELQKIKKFTMLGGELEDTVKQNASLMATLANIQKIDITNLPPLLRTQLDMSYQSNQNMSHEEHDSFRNSMDESQ